MKKVLTATIFTYSEAIKVFSNYLPPSASAPLDPLANMTLGGSTLNFTTIQNTTIESN